MSRNVSRNKFPTIKHTVEMLQNDSGCPLSVSTILRWHDKLPSIERELRLLTKKQLENFTFGEDTEQRAILKKRPALRDAHKFLADVFEGR